MAPVQIVFEVPMRGYTYALIMTSAVNTPIKTGAHLSQGDIIAKG
jgi:hypothetical protein